MNKLAVGRPSTCAVWPMNLILKCDQVSPRDAACGARQQLITVQLSSQCSPLGDEISGLPCSFAASSSPLSSSASSS